MKEFTPIILLSSERSGTNLLRALVSSHSAVASPPPCSIVDVLADIHYRYFPPDQAPHLADLVEDAITLTKSHLNPWDIDLTPQIILEKLGSASFWDLFRVINEMYAEKSGRPFWFSKEPGLFKHIYEISTHMPNAKYIYMARDGRDVAASMINGGIQEFHVYNAAQHWAQDQKYCLCALSDPVIRSQMFMLKYEDLIGNTEEIIRQLMEFIGLEFEPKQMEYYKKKSVIKHASTSEFWKNISKPIDSTNKGKYRETLGKREITIFESVAWTEMNLLGYPLESQARKRITLLARAVFWISTQIRRRAKRVDKNDGNARIRARTKIFREIRNRKFSS